MRKACMAGISVLIGISMLAGCGKSLDADTDTCLLYTSPSPRDRG